MGTAAVEMLSDDPQIAAGRGVPNLDLKVRPVAENSRQLGPVAFGKQDQLFRVEVRQLAIRRRDDPVAASSVVLTY